MMLAAPSQVTGVDEMTRHEGASVNCSSPDVIVSSEYVPLALAVNVPVTWRDPVTGADGQLAPATVRSSAPATLRQDDVTVQVPTTSPAAGTSRWDRTLPRAAASAWARRSGAACARRSAGAGVASVAKHSERDRKRQRCCSHLHGETIGAIRIALLTNQRAAPMGSDAALGSAAACAIAGSGNSINKMPPPRISARR